MFKQLMLYKTRILAILVILLLSFAHTAILIIPTYSEQLSNTGKTTVMDTLIDEDGEAPPGLSEDSDLSDLSPAFASALIIKALYPGDSSDNANEFIELYKTIDDDLDLSGYQLRYTNGSGTNSIIWEFADGTIMTGQTIVLRYSKSPDAANSDAVYTSSLARTAGPLEVLLDGEPVDSVCWAGSSKTGCVAGYKTGETSILVRDLTDDTFSKIDDYTPNYDSTGHAVTWPVPVEDDIDNPTADETAEAISARCQGLQFTEIYSYYDGDQTEQFIELYNSTSQTIDLSHCSLGYKKKTYSLSGLISPSTYQEFYPSSLGFSLTKNPASTNSVTLVEINGQVVDELVYPHGQKKATSYALIFTTSGEALWRTTYARTPGVENVYQKFRTCETGKVINEATGNCVKAETLESTLVDCPEGKYRNPLTGRCKNLTSESTVKPCADGYERNPETNRCRKIVSENSGAGYALVPTTGSSDKNFVAIGAVILIMTAGTIYIILQYRMEIIRLLRKLRQRIHHIG